MNFIKEATRKLKIDYSGIRDNSYTTVFIIIAIIAVMVSSFSETAIASPTCDRLPPNFQVDSTQAVHSLTHLFERNDGWTGADDGYSIPLNATSSLWLFGDTFIGAVKNNRRVISSLINNSVAICNSNQSVVNMNFFNFDNHGKPDSMFRTGTPGQWFWPGDGANVLGKVYIFMHLIEKREQSSQTPFNFIETMTKLMVISNPLDPPYLWKQKYIPLPDTANGARFGNSCFIDRDYLYVYCTAQSLKSAMSQHPIMLARIQIRDLDRSDIKSWRYYCYATTRGAEKCWSNSNRNPVILFSDGAAELTVTKVPGLSGYFATYIPSGISKNILIRRALKPEGPWSDAQIVYQCPVITNRTFVYGAKSHPELASKNGEMVITYCRNVLHFHDNILNARLYNPQFIKVHIADGQRSR